MYFSDSFHRVRIKNGPGFLPRPNFFLSKSGNKKIMSQQQFFQTDTLFQKNILIPVAKHL